MMNESIEERIGRYLAGEGSNEEREQLIREVESNPVLLEQFRILQQVWRHSHTPAQAHWDIEKGWARFTNQVKEEPPIQLYSRRRVMTRLAVAASILIFLSLGLFIWSQQRPMGYAYDPNNSDPIVLADGSKVYLNKDASINVYSFNRKKRLVELSGEAYFEVAPDSKKPFIVNAGSTSTEVVGTVFNIDQSEARTTIYVTEGKVIFRSLKHVGSAIALTSGEAGVFKEEKIQRIVNPSPNFHAWHSKELQFRDMPLSDVIADITSYFDMDIAIENENIKNCRVTIPLSFKEPEIKSVLSAVAMSLNAEFQMDGTKCTIRGGNCPL